MAEPAELIDRWRGMSGIELIKALADGRLPRARHAEFVGIHMVDAASGRVELGWQPSPDLVNAQGTVHGGYIAMVLDDACCLAGGTLNDPFVPMVTLSLHVDYLRPVRPGQRYVVTGTVTHAGRRRVVSTATMTDDQGRAVAQASANVSPNRSFDAGANADRAERR